VYSRLSDEDVNKALFKPTKDIEQTLEELKEKYGKDMTVAVLPQGPLTIPYVEE
jgi:nickel-dependent lactate racemase